MDVILKSDRASVGRSGKTSLIHGGPTSQLTGLKGPAANVLEDRGLHIVDHDRKKKFAPEILLLPKVFNRLHEKS